MFALELVSNTKSDMTLSVNKLISLALQNNWLNPIALGVWVVVLLAHSFTKYFRKHIPLLN